VPVHAGETPQAGPPATGAAAGRAAFLAERRAISVRRFDELHSPHYDEHWGGIGAGHAAFVTRLAGLVRPGGEVLDAACGTGKYWPMLLAAGLGVTGTDQSAGMLGRASSKHPQVPVRRIELQGLLAVTGLHDRFDGLICVDAMECVAPEHWPGVAAGLAAALRPGAPGYLTVERYPGPLPPAADPRQVPGEVIEDGSYHYYPTLPQVRQWLATAGFTTVDQAEASDYWHFLVARG
jgi:cyclopropane fatty-acyl-phospholipid synthase-like methyltransferase